MDGSVFWMSPCAPAPSMFPIINHSFRGVRWYAPITLYMAAPLCKGFTINPYKSYASPGRARSGRFLLKPSARRSGIMPRRQERRLPRHRPGSAGKPPIWGRPQWKSRWNHMIPAAFLIFFWQGSEPPPPAGRRQRAAQRRNPRNGRAPHLSGSLSHCQTGGVKGK